MRGARQYAKNCRPPCEKIDVPVVFWHIHLKGRWGEGAP